MGNQNPADNPVELLNSTGFSEYLSISSGDYFKNVQNYSDQFVDEIINGAMNVVYNQNDTSNAFTGFVTLAAATD